MNIAIIFACLVTAAPIFFIVVWMELVPRLRRSGGRVIGDDVSFALWRWQDIHWRDGNLYLRKLYLARTPLGQVSVHWMFRPDPDRDPHDHPRSFISFVLRGGYTEERYTVVVPPRPPARQTRLASTSLVRLSGDVAYRRAEELHRIAAIEPGTVTLVLWGRRRRPWGFHNGRVWVFWRDYLGLDRSTSRSSATSLFHRVRSWFR